MPTRYIDSYFVVYSFVIILHSQKLFRCSQEDILTHSTVLEIDHQVYTQIAENTVWI